MSADVGVVGAGIAGLATAYALRERGARVTVYERAAPGAGQSGGESRIFRHTHEDPRLVAFAASSRELWREWERRSGIELLSDDGVLSLGPSVPARSDRLAAAGVPARLLDPRQVGEHLAPLAPIAGPALLDELGGVLRTRAAIAWLASELADTFITDEIVAVTPTAAGTVRVRAAGATTEHERVIVCAGRGTAALARGAGVEIPIREFAHVRLAFRVTGPPPPRLACLLDGSNAFGEPSAYADPLPGNGRYAVGVDETPVVSGSGLAQPGGLDAIAQRTIAYVRRALPGLDPEPEQARHCFITELPWAYDAFAAWDAGPATFLAGHNLFKHAPALGRTLAARTLGEPAEIDLSPAAQLGAVSTAAAPAG